MRWLLPLIVVLSAPLAAQDAPRDTTLPPDTERIDVRVLRTVYDIEAAPFELTMRAVNLSAYPVYWGASPAMWIGALATGADTRPALEMTLTQGANFATTYALKRLISRPRPYAALDDIVARDRGHQGDEIFDPYSFPSGHTSSAFAIATSLSLSYPEWYVVVPSVTWASLMGATRVWHGVHYPSDVLVGAGIGAGTAFAVYLLTPLVTGGRSDDEGAPAAAARPLHLVIPL